jgi:urea transporter
MTAKQYSQINFGLWTAIGVAIGANFGLLGAIIGVAAALLVATLIHLILRARQKPDAPQS